MTFTVHPVPGHGAEDVVVAPDGSVYTGTEDGIIWRLSATGARMDKIADTRGRPLGLELFDDGDLLVCDARQGLLVVHVADGSIETLLSDIDGTPMRFCNNAAIASDGTIWFTDSSLHYSIDQWKDDFVQHTRTGRLIRRDVDGTVSVVLDDLAFANGVALSSDEQFVAVAETGARTVARWWIAGPRAGERDFLVRDLPGYPDNIARGSDGLIWVTIASPKDPVVERLQTAPVALRKLITRIPETLQPKPKETIRVQAFDNAGTLVRDVDLPDSGYHMVTGVREHEGRVWMGSLHEPAVAVFEPGMK